MPKWKASISSTHCFNHLQLKKLNSKGTLPTKCIKYRQMHRSINREEQEIMESSWLVIIISVKAVAAKLTDHQLWGLRSDTVSRQLLWRNMRRQALTYLGEMSTCWLQGQTFLHQSAACHQCLSTASSPCQVNNAQLHYTHAHAHTHHVCSKWSCSFSLLQEQ